MDKLELNGAACVFYGDKDGRIWGLVLWYFAVELKSSCDYLQIPQIDLEQSSLEKCVLNGKKWSKKKLTEDDVFIRVLFFIELCNLP